MQAQRPVGVDAAAIGGVADLGMRVGQAVPDRQAVERKPAPHGHRERPVQLVGVNDRGPGPGAVDRQHVEVHEVEAPRRGLIARIARWSQRDLVGAGRQGDGVGGI